jgi:hypothetical protein
MYVCVSLVASIGCGYTYTIQPLLEQRAVDHDVVEYICVDNVWLVAIQRASVVAQLDWTCAVIGAVACIVHLSIS